VAPYQVVIVPIPRGNWQETVLPRARELQSRLQARGVRVHLDAREEHTPGWKFAEWELRGVPLRLELGPKDLELQQVVLARRDTRAKQAVPVAELEDRVSSLLEDIQYELLARALAFREAHTGSAATYEEFKATMEGRPGFVYAYWCGSDQCEAEIKAETQATIRNLPFDEDKDGRCIKCGRPAVTRARFAKAY
jgi:prolyl-tRNA synthetase